MGQTKYLDTLAGVVVAAVCQALWLSISGNMIALITDDIDRKADFDTPRREPFLRVRWHYHTPVRRRHQGGARGGGLWRR